MANDTFKVINDQGQEITCDILFTFDNEENGKSYIVYTDNTLDANGNTNVMASIYDPTQKNPRLEPIETEEEWAMIEKILSSLQKGVRGNWDQERLEELFREEFEDMDGNEDFYSDICDDFYFEEPQKDVLAEKLKHTKKILIRFHVYEMQDKYNEKDITTAEYEKIGIVDITGKNGSFTIGSNMLNDIWFPDQINMNSVEVILGVINERLLLQPCHQGWANFFNNKKMGLTKNSCHFYEVEHGDEFIIAKDYKFCVEILEFDKIEIKQCPICGKDFVAASDGEIYCFDCRYEMKQEMGICSEKELQQVSIGEYKRHPQVSDLTIKVTPENPQRQKVFAKIF